MTTTTHRRLRNALLTMTMVLWCAGGLAQVIERFPIAAGPRSIALGPDGAMWFTHDGYTIGRIDSGGVVTEFPLPANDSSFLDIALGPDGNLWLTRSEFAALVPGISRLTPSGALTEFRVADALSITAGPDGNLWFTQIYSPRIGRITTSGTVTEFDLLTPSRVGDITAGPDGNIWFTKPDGHKIGRITSSGAVTEFDVPGGRPRGIAAGPDGNVWFTDESLPRIGRITPAGEITQFPTSRAAYAIVSGADGNLWAAGPLTLMRITPSGSMTDFFLPAKRIDGWYPAIASAPDGSIWVTDRTDSQIVRFSLAPTACLTDATTLCLNNGRFRVAADWRTRDGSSGQGSAVSLTPDSGYFWFFDAANIEVVVKVLNGCGLNSRYWTFAAGLTDVNVILTVTDTQTGAIRTYTNPQGAPFQPIQDTDAFAACP
jgi:virginiamycin B lyase